MEQTKQASLFDGYDSGLLSPARKEGTRTGAGVREPEQSVETGVTAQGSADPGKKKEPTDHWSEIGMIFSTGGNGYIIKRTPDGELKTVCAGPGETPISPYQTPPGKNKPVAKVPRIGRPRAEVSRRTFATVKNENMTLRQKAEKTGLSKDTIRRLIKNDQVAD